MRIIESRKDNLIMAISGKPFCVLGIIMYLVPGYPVIRPSSHAAPGRRILAADESSGTIKKRFDALSAESAADNRHEYRGDEQVRRCEI
jgi:hypothetical protein